MVATMRNRHLRSTAVAQMLDLVPSYLPGPAVSPHARELASRHYPKPCQAMREFRCCSLPPESRFSLSISHSHPLSSLTLLKVALFHSRLLGCHLGATPNEPATVHCPKAASSREAKAASSRIVVQLTGAHSLD